MTNVTPLPKTQDPFKIRNTKYEFVSQAKKYLENRLVEATQRSKSLLFE